MKPTEAQESIMIAAEQFAKSELEQYLEQFHLEWDGK